MRTHPCAPAAVRTAVVVTVAVVVAALAGGCTGGGGEPSPVTPRSQTRTLSPSDPATYAGELFAWTNAMRADEGVAAVVESSCAQVAALQRADALVGAAELTHASLTEVITQCAPESTAAENLSRAAAEPADVMAAWMQSSGHRSNLLDPELTELGVGCVLDGAEMLCSQVYLGP